MAVNLYRGLQSPDSEILCIQKTPDCSIACFVNRRISPKITNSSGLRCHLRVRYTKRKHGIHHCHHRANVKTFLQGMTGSQPVQWKTNPGSRQDFLINWPRSMACMVAASSKTQKMQKSNCKWAPLVVEPRM